MSDRCGISSIEYLDDFFGDINMTGFFVSFNQGSLSFGLGNDDKIGLFSSSNNAGCSRFSGIVNGSLSSVGQIAGNICHMDILGDVCHI